MHVDQHANAGEEECSEEVADRFDLAAIIGLRRKEQQDIFEAKYIDRIKEIEIEIDINTINIIHSEIEIEIVIEIDIIYIIHSEIEIEIVIEIDIIYIIHSEIEIEIVIEIDIIYIIHSEKEK